MQINQGANAPRGSFGIPPEMQEAQQRAKAQADAERAEKAQVEAPPVPPEAAAPADEGAKELTPTDMLKTLGVTFDDKDLHNLLFRGYIEKDIAVIPKTESAGKVVEFRSKFKTLTGDEYDAVDELIAADVETTKMTNDGFKSRRAMWILSLGILEINGKALIKPILNSDTKEVDLHAMAKARRKLLGAMSPLIVNHMIQKHGALTVAVDMISADPSGALKNS